MNYLFLIPLALYLYVIHLQVKNYLNFRDQNGQDKVRLQFIFNVTMLSLIVVAAFFRWWAMTALLHTILASSCWAFYKGIDIRFWK